MNIGEFIFWNALVLVSMVILFLVYEYALIMKRIRLKMYKDLPAQ